MPKKRLFSKKVLNLFFVFCAARQPVIASIRRMRSNPLRAMRVFGREFYLKTRLCRVVDCFGDKIASQ